MLSSANQNGLKTEKTSITHWPKCRLAFAFAFLIAEISLAQPDAEIDSLTNLLKTVELDTNKVNILNDLSYRLQQTSDYEKALFHSYEALKLSQKLIFRQGEARAYDIAGLICSSQGNYATSLTNHHTSLSIYKEIGDKKGIADALKHIGLIHWSLGKYPEAIENYFAALKIYEELRNKIGMASTYNNIAIIYDLEQNSSEALKYYELALKIAKELNHQYGIAVCNTNIGIINQTQGNCDKALENHLVALKIWLDIGEKSGVVNSYKNIGDIYSCQNNETEALSNYMSSLKIAEEIGSKHEMAIAHAAIGGTFSNLKQYPKAKHHLTIGLSLSKEVGASSEIKKTYAKLSVLSSEMGNFEEALLYYKKYDLYQDSLFNEAKSKQIAQIKEQYESEKRNKEILVLTNEKQQLENDKILALFLLRAKQDSLNIAQSEKEKVQLENEKFYTLNLVNRQQIELLGNERMLQKLQSDKSKLDFAIQKVETDKKQEQLTLLNKEKAIRELELKKEKLTKYYFLAGLGLFIILSFFIYRNYRTRQEIKLLTLRNKIASDLHDDVGSTLSSISMLTQIAQSHSKETIPALETIGESSRKMLDAMADIVWSINPDNDQFDKVVMRMREFAFELLGTRQMDFEFDTDEDFSKINLSMNARKNLYLIFKEATNNLAKYSDANKVYFSLKGNKDKLLMVIRDDGKGFDIAKESRGNGLLNMRKRAVEMGAYLGIESKLGFGTTIQLELLIK